MLYFLGLSLELRRFVYQHWLDDHPRFQLLLPAPALNQINTVAVHEDRMENTDHHNGLPLLCRMINLEMRDKFLEKRTCHVVKMWNAINNNAWGFPWWFSGPQGQGGPNPAFNHLYLGIEEDHPCVWPVAQWSQSTPQPWFLRLQRELRVLALQNGLERFEIEWSVPDPRVGMHLYLDPPAQAGVFKVREYGYIVGKKDEKGMWVVKFWDEQGGMLRWHTMEVDGVDCVDTWRSYWPSVYRLRHLATEPF